MAKVSKKSEKITAFGGKLTWGQSPCEPKARLSHTPHALIARSL